MQLIKNVNELEIGEIYHIRLFSLKQDRGSIVFKLDRIVRNRYSSKGTAYIDNITSDTKFTDDDEFRVTVISDSDTQESERWESGSIRHLDICNIENAIRYKRIFKL